MEIVPRTYWIDRIEGAWRQRSVVWLSGVRRSGKTTLSQTLEGVEYFDCELPRVRRLMEEIEPFLKSLQGKRVILDEIHRLPHPSELLKVAADHYPKTRILATGSSTLAATRKFRDSLTGRKIEIWLTPMIRQDLLDFKMDDLPRRLQRGGLPPFFLAHLPEREFQSWLDDFWTKDIQELFRLERHASFLKFIELLLVRSGGIFEATAFAPLCEISRTTVQNYLSALEVTRVAHVLKPYSLRKTVEIVSAPKVYAFDTGFISYFRGWDQTLRSEEKGLLWEHYVLNELQGVAWDGKIHYWRDKRGHEVDFVLLPRGKPPMAVEAKWSERQFDPSALRSFRHHHPEGRNFVVAEDIDRPFRRSEGGLTFEFCSLEHFIKESARKS